MKDFLDILSELRNTPIPVLLIGGGILFLFIAVGGQFGAKVGQGDKGVKEWPATIIGTVLLIFGIALYIVPLIFSPSSATDVSDIAPDSPPTDTPKPTPDTAISTTEPTDILTDTNNPNPFITEPGDWDADVSVGATTLRRQPDFSSDELVTLSRGDHVNISATNESKNWVLVFAPKQGRAGWLRTEHLTLYISLDDLPVRAE